MFNQEIKDRFRKMMDFKFKMACVIGIFLLIYGIWMQYDEYRYKNKSIEVTGEVLQNTIDGHTIIGYAVDDNNYQLKYTLSRRVNKGDKIPVVYMPNKPQRGRLTNDNRNSQAPLLILVGLVMGVFGSFVWYKKW